MEAGQARIGQIEPRSADAGGEPDLADRGTQSIREVMVATEVQVASMLERADSAVARMIADADSRSRAQVSDRRRQLADVRRELALWAAAVAAGFENVLGLLDEADERMAVPEPPRAVPDPPPAPAREAAPEPRQEAPSPPRLRLAQSPDPAAAGRQSTVSRAGEDVAAGGQEGSPRPRWWRRWFRQAA